jgi:hypothetical protein
VPAHLGPFAEAGRPLRMLVEVVQSYDKYTRPVENRGIESN